MSSSVGRISNFDELQRVYDETRNAETRNNFHLSDNVLLESVKTTAYEWANQQANGEERGGKKIPGYRGYSVSMVSSLSVFRAEVDKQISLLKQMPEGQRNVDLKDQCLRRHWQYIAAFIRLRIEGFLFRDIALFLAPSASKVPSEEKVTGWALLGDSIGTFSATAAEVDGRNQKQQEAIDATQRELGTSSDKALQEIEGQHSGAVLSLVRLFNVQTLLRSAEESGDVDEFFARKREFIEKLYKDTRTIDDQESPRVDNVSKVLSQFRTFVSHVNTHLQKRTFTADQKATLEGRIQLYKDLVEYLKVEVRKIGVLAAQLKQVAALMNAPQLATDVGPATSLSQFPEIQKAQEACNKEAAGKALELLQRAKRLEEVYFNSMEQLEVFNSDPEKQTLRYGLERFFAHRECGWEPLTQAHRFWNYLGSAVEGWVASFMSVFSSARVVTPFTGRMVYELNFFDRPLTPKAATAPLPTRAVEASEAPKAATAPLPAAPAHNGEEDAQAM